MALPTGPYIGRHPELHMSATKPEVEITFEQKELARDSNATPYVRPYPTYADKARHWRISETQNVGHETGK